MMKRLAYVIAVLCTMVTLFAAEAKAEKKIGILIWSEENRYSDALKGIMEELKKEGFGEPQVKFTIENAKGNKAKAMELAQKFASAKMDMLIALGTSVTVPAAKLINDVPIIFSVIYDPVEAKIAADWKSSGNNTTGSSNKVSMSQLVKTLKQLGPVKTLAVLYTSGEKNSEAQLKELQGIQADSQIKVVSVLLTSKEEVARVIPDVAGTVDAMYLSGSNVVAETAALIVNIATKAKVITVTHVEDLVDKGVLLGVYANPYAVGRLAGEKAAKVLKGAKPSSIPIEALKKMDVIVNMKTAKAGNFNIPPAFLKSVTKTVE